MLKGTPWQRHRALTWRGADVVEALSSAGDGRAGNSMAVDVASGSKSSALMLPQISW